MRDEITLIRAFGVSIGEARVLLALFSGGVWSRNRLLQQLGSGSDYDRMIDVYICRLRRKFGKHSIITLHRIGYEIGRDMARTLTELLSADMAA
jgi:DNA-binding response OmpR family regulator